MKRMGLLGFGVVAALGAVQGSAAQQAKGRTVDWNKPYIVVEPQTTRAIQGVSAVDRKRYFCVSDPGVGFEKRVKDDAMYDYLVNDLGISFGRGLGPVKYAASKLKEDRRRPGFADITPLKKKTAELPTERMRSDFGPNFDVASHGSHNAFPAFMGKFETRDSVKGDHPQYIPENIEAAALLSAAIMKFNYTDYDRPKYYELVNEPHWSFFNEQHMADWHVKTMETVHKATPEVQVGGLCMSVCYFYRGNYKSFNGLKNFIDNTDAKMDFYSFHTYDYLRWNGTEFKGRLQSGLALEGTLDLVQNYTMNEFGKEVDVVVSEQGGYIGSKPKGDFDGEVVASTILAEHYPAANTNSWDYEMKKRSVATFGHVSSIMANTLAFMDHPHTVQKAVPFILTTTWNWGPKYYAQMFVAKDYEDESEWVEQDTTMFYKFFKGVNGRRVKALCSDPDLQTRAFVDGSKLYLAVNNQSFTPETIDLYGIRTPTVTIRRFGRNADFTAAFSEETVATPETLILAGRDSVMIVADYGQPVPQKRAVNEVVCYGDKIGQLMDDATFKIKVPRKGKIDYAQLRIGLTRSPDSSKTPIIKLNGEGLDVPLEDCAERFVDKEYAMTKLIYLNPADLKSVNTVKVSFPDGSDGAVGTAVIRVAVKEN